MQARDVAQTATDVAPIMATAETGRKNRALAAMADRLEARKEDLIAANRNDMKAAAESGLPEKLVSRLGFDESKIDSRMRALGKIQRLPDPVGQTFKTQRRPNGLEVARVRVPLGVILMIYEARPHVTVNAGAFCLKSGNAAILRGGSEAETCNALLGDLWRESLAEAGLPEDAVQVVSGSHEEVQELLCLKNHIDLVIPRGGERLIEVVERQSAIPVIKHFAGICHVFLDEDCDLTDAIEIVLDAKCLMPEVCNAAETLLVSEALADELPRIGEALREAGVTVRGCGRTRAALPWAEAAEEEDWSTEYLDMIMSVRVVEEVGEAIEHINRYGSHHTDAIVTDSLDRARRFVREVDSGVVPVNASTMFCDGESLGMGAEIGISTDKLHARGPMGLEDLTTYKHVIHGQGHVLGEGATR